MEHSSKYKVGDRVWAWYKSYTIHLETVTNMGVGTVVDTFDNNHLGIRFDNFPYGRATEYHPFDFDFIDFYKEPNIVLKGLL